MAYQGYFKPKNIQKYKGDSSKIVYRSSWEAAFMKWLDDNPKVLRWSSEEIIIPYRSPIDGRIHRYFVDFSIIFNTGDHYIVEIKPFAQTIQPKKKAKQRDRTWMKLVENWGKNVAKWEAAETWAYERGYRFFVWTEKDLKTLGIPVLTEYTNFKKGG